MIRPQKPSCSPSASSVGITWELVSSAGSWTLFPHLQNAVGVVTPFQAIHMHVSGRSSVLLFLPALAFSVSDSLIQAQKASELFTAAHMAVH